MRKTLITLTLGMVMGYLVTRSNKCQASSECCSCESDNSSCKGNSQSSMKKISDGFDYIIQKIDSINLEDLKLKTRETIESIKEKVMDLKSY